jgi:integrase
MTERSAHELAILYAQNSDPDAVLFGIGSTKGAWNKVRQQAGVTDLRFHDLRHTYATRLASKHLPLSEVGRVLRHAANDHLPVPERKCGDGTTRRRRT